jgi:hypothetical protein
VCVCLMCGHVCAFASRDALQLCARRPRWCLPPPLLMLAVGAICAVVLGTAHGFTVSNSITSAAVGPVYVHAADMDGDGLVDVLSASASGSRVSWYKNNGGSPPSWTEQFIALRDSARAVVAADLDGDGRMDAVSASANDFRITWHRNGGGVPIVWTATDLSTSARGVTSLATCDIDRDGRLDVVSAVHGLKLVTWHRNPASGGVWANFSVATSSTDMSGVACADVDGDGRPDAVSASWGENTVAWHRNVLSVGSTLSWETQSISNNAAGATAVACADVDGDGRVDVLSASQSDNRVTWYRNGGGVAGSPAEWTSLTISSSVSGTTFLHAVDMNADGRCELGCVAGCWWTRWTVPDSCMGCGV